MSEAVAPMPEPAGLREAFWEFEHAWQTADVNTVCSFFVPGNSTLRGSAEGLVVGIEAVADSLAKLEPAERTLAATHVQTLDDDHAFIVAEATYTDGSTSVQSQMWSNDNGRWQLTALHTTQSPALLDTQIWRVIGEPLVPRTSPGALDGQTVAVADLVAVAGQRIGNGNEQWLREAAMEQSHSPAVASLLANGADIRGVAQAEEFAWAHGATSGATLAVSQGQATIGLDTDGGGSVRVPAAYQGLYGIRTSVGAISTERVVPLSPTFDAIGWTTNDPALLEAVGQALLPANTDLAASSSPIKIVDEFLSLVDHDVADAVIAFADEVGAESESWDISALSQWCYAFVDVQSAEAWLNHGDWVEAHWDSLGAAVRTQFEAARSHDPEQVQKAGRNAAMVRKWLHSVMRDRVVLMPTTSTPPPESGDLAEAVLQENVALTCIASLGGLPALTIPLTTAAGRPCGVTLMASPGRDLDLLRLATAWA